MSQKSNDYYQQTGVAMTCRSYEEYVRMFALAEDRLQGLSILDMAGGASSFAAEAAGRGNGVTAVDPLYAMSAEEIREHGEREIEVSTAKLAGLAHQYRWDFYGSLDRHRAMRVQSLHRFLADYGAEHPAVTYMQALLPKLPLSGDRFDLTLCSHFLFLYEDQFDYDFHRAAVAELLRVTKPGGEVRVYPLFNFRTEQYSHLDRLRRDIEAEGAASRLEESQLPFLPNSGHLLVFRKKEFSAGV
ncbi:methylase [Gordoniibacillus kamchatkensis]|uniref:Methylase n=1 Tax=Gordoniibacillus kamchatkensis TaxID=1590651 RepID=A0ABR5AA99_9BACL|nr:class I SAM-dependent methyltransferase [Paenibacillus sp. VKM B-2647]KIL37763.1 methylase [Paenibacillus sp. VKM B-2647]